MIANSVRNQVPIDLPTTCSVRLELLIVLYYCFSFIIVYHIYYYDLL